MQAGGSGPSPSPHPFPTHSLPHIVDYDAKKRYLALLPAEQIIEICLKLDSYTPTYIRSTIWPVDLPTAISSLQKSSSKDTLSTTLKPPDPQQDEPKAPDKSSASQPAASSSPSTFPSYPHYSYGPQGHAYGHVPYYTGYSYTHYGYPPPGGYPAQPHPEHSFYTSGPTIIQSQHNELAAGGSGGDKASGSGAAEDLPSYEEMIVQALLAIGEPDGAAPKDVFTWMAAHYRVQSNFRPSASQALQKAYRRGRFEKNPNGKYRLKAGWEGTASAKRNTRRPQVPYSTAISYSQSPQPDFSAPSNPPASTGKENAPGGSGDVYEAARNILKSINFGTLLGDDQNKQDVPRSNSSPQPGDEENRNVVTAPGLDSLSTGRVELQKQLSLLASQLLDFSQEPDPPPDEADHNSSTLQGNNALDAPPGKEEEAQKDDQDDDQDMEEVAI